MGLGMGATLQKVRSISSCLPSRFIPNLPCLVGE